MFVLFGSELMGLECAKVRAFDHAIFMLSLSCMYRYVEYIVILNMYYSIYVSPVAWARGSTMIWKLRIPKP